LHQGKKVKALYSGRNLRPELLATLHSKALSNGRLRLFKDRKINYLNFLKKNKTKKGTTLSDNPLLAKLLFAI
jgi:hypothetical protein